MQCILCTLLRAIPFVNVLNVIQVLTREIEKLLYLFMGGKRTAIRERYGRLDVGYMTIKAALLARLDLLILARSSLQSYIT